VLFFLIWSAAVLAVYTQLDVTVIALPFLPVATIGTAVAFYVGFKNNASYERLWEARKIWAEIEHDCRMLAYSVAPLTSKVGLSDAVKSEFLHRQIAWINSLRLMLRQTNPFHEDAIAGTDQAMLANKTTGIDDIHADSGSELRQWLSQQDIDRLAGASNVPATLLSMQMQALNQFEENGLEDWRADRIHELLKDLSQQQCASERINSFPFPRQYAYFSSLFVNIFIVLLPFSLLSELKTDPRHLWLLIPFSVLISWVFDTMEKVGDTSENPFENGLNDVPLSAICRNVEIEIKRALNERDIPAPLMPKEHILM